MNPNEIRDLRRRLGWSQAQMAQFMGVTDMAVSKWERGRTRPDPFKQAALEQLRRRLDQAEAEHRREQFEEALRAVAVGAGVGVLLAFLFGGAKGDGDDEQDE